MNIVLTIGIILSFFIILATFILAHAVSLLFGQSIEQFHFSGWFLLSSGMFPVWFMLIIAPILEELAWHTFGTDSLRSRFNLFITSVIFAAYWCIWHLPLFLIKNYYNKDFFEEGLIYYANFFIGLFPLVIIMNWIYYKANRNILLPVIFHITALFFIEIFSTFPISKLIQTILLMLFSILILARNKKMFFTKKNAWKAPAETFRFRKEMRNLGILIIAGFVF